MSINDLPTLRLSNGPIPMKTQRVIIVVLSLLVVVLAYLSFSNRKQPGQTPQTNTAANTTEMWHTNTLENWRTNTVERWFTNTVAITNTVTQPITNEVLKEVPAKLSTDERQAAILGYNYIHAPLLQNASDALYKLGPVAIDVYVAASDSTVLGENTDELRKKVELALRSQNIPVAEKSQNVLRFNLNPLWRMSDPRVALVRCRLDLKGPASLQRQNDIIKCDSIVWSTTTSKFIRTIDMPESVDKCIQEPLDRFCKDYREAKEKEKELESRIPKVSANFLSGEQ
jgi:hypothetical protein